MLYRSSLIRLGRLVVIGSVVACAAATAAGAAGIRGTASPDVFERYAATHSSDPATAPDVVERYVATHSLGTATVARAAGTERIVDDWFREPPKPAAPAGDRIVDDSFRESARYVPSTSSGNGGLDWEDFGIGAGAMLGLTLVVAGLGIGALAMRHRSGRLETP
jgi:hypothetical protein